MENYWEGWGFSDRIPVTISATPRKIEILKLELAKSFPDNQVDELDSRNIRFYAREEQLKKLKKFVSTLNGKVYYANGGKLESKKLVYVLYDPTPKAMKIFNENGRTYFNWWQSDLNRGESEQLLKKLQMENLIIGGLRYTGDSSDLKFEQGGDIGEVLATSNPYIGGAKVIQGIAPESVSALDKKMASQINPDPNRPIFFKKGGVAEQNKIRKVMHEFKEGELHSSSGQKVTDRKQAIAIALSEAGVSKYVGGGGVSKKEPKYYVFEVSYSMRKRGENRNQAGIYKQTITESATTEKGAEREAIKTIRSMHKYENVVFNHIAPKLIKEMTLLEYIESQRPKKYDNGGGVESLKIGDRVYGYFIYNYMGYHLVDSRMGGNLVYGEIKDIITENNQKKYVIKFENGETEKVSVGIFKEYLFVDKKFDNGGNVGQNDYSVARIILQQLGGQGKLVVMTGANNFIAFSNGVSFKLKSRKANYVKITLNGNDLYDIQFQKLFGMKSKVVAEYNDIYFDQLIPIVEKETGMYLKMFKKGGIVSTQNRDMVISQLKTIHHHEQEMLQTLKNSGEVEAWVLAKVSNASSDLSDIAHYLEFKG